MSNIKELDSKYAKLLLYKCLSFKNTDTLLIEYMTHEHDEFVKTIIEEAKKNANRIVNEALLRAEKTEYEANMLRRNINIFKRRLRSIIEAQLEMVNDIDHIEM